MVRRVPQFARSRRRTVHPAESFSGSIISYDRHYTEGGMSLLKKSGANTRLNGPLPDDETRTQPAVGEADAESKAQPVLQPATAVKRAHVLPWTGSTARLSQIPAPFTFPVRPAGQSSGPTEAPGRKTASSIGPSSHLPGVEEQHIADAHRLQAGTILQERYVVEGLLGVGGMSVVYRGRDLRFKDVVRTCAIKEMFQSAPDSQTRSLLLKNFEREAGLLATLSHPAIPKVYDFFEERGKIYLVLELIAGHDLESELEIAGHPFDEARVAAWAIQICDVLTYLHCHEPEPIIFRDLKPSNIIVTPQDRIMLIDFGIARVFQGEHRRGTMIGTEGYAPPEQYRGIGDRRVDIYALGATLHHLLSGVDPRMEAPFTFHERPLRTLNPGISEEMETVVVRSTEYNAATRPSSAEEMKALLLRVPALRGASISSVDIPPAPAIAAASTGMRRIVWQVACEDEVRSSPHIRDGNLYIGSYDRYLYCLNAPTGELVWKRATSKGISSSPTTWSELVLVGSEDGQLYALDARRGTPRWSFRTGRAIRSSPRVEDRIIYVGSDDQHVYAIDGLNGRKLWQYRTWMPVRSSSAIDQHGVYIGSSDGFLYSLDPLKGGLRWKQKTQGPIVSTPTLGANLVYVGSMDGHLYAVDSEGGNTVWKFKTGHGINSSPVVDESRVFVGGVDGFVYAVDARSGKLAWKFNAGAQVTASVRISQGSLYVAGVDGRLSKLDAETGTLIWNQSCGGPIVSTPAVADGLVFFGSLDRHIYALEA